MIKPSHIYVGIYYAHNTYRYDDKIALGHILNKQVSFKEGTKGLKFLNDPSNYPWMLKGMDYDHHHRNHHHHHPYHRNHYHHHYYYHHHHHHHPYHHHVTTLFLIIILASLSAYMSLMTKIISIIFMINIIIFIIFISIFIIINIATM
jgi:hypothetical protein